MTRWFEQGSRDASAQLGLQKTAMGIPLRGAARAATQAAPEVAQATAQAAPGFFARMGNKGVPLKYLAGAGAVGAGATLAGDMVGPPQVEVHPSLPMRTMFP